MFLQHADWKWCAIETQNQVCWYNYQPRIYGFVDWEAVFQGISKEVVSKG